VVLVPSGQNAIFIGIRFANVPSPQLRHRFVPRLPRVSDYAVNRLCFWANARENDIMFSWKKNKPAVVASATKEQVTDLSPALSELDDFIQPRKKVLLIEDDPVVVKMLSFALGKGGYRVLTTDDASAAIGLMRDEKPDMLLVDVTLPPDIGSGAAQLADGFHLTRWLHYATGKKTPTIIISGANKPDYQRKAMDAGATEFIAKPVDHSLLLASIASALNQSHSAGAGFAGMRMVS
jgi:CheY-like chemotaxis protein